MKRKYAGTIVLTETGSKVTGFDTLYSFEQRLALMDAGIPPTAILVTAKHVGSTRDEARAVFNLLGNDNTHDIIVVTDSYHTFRTRLLWREVFRESGISVIVRPARGGWYKSTTWWLSPLDGRQLFWNTQNSRIICFFKKVTRTSVFTPIIQ